MGYENRISAIAALVQETYALRMEEAKTIAVELDNMYR